MNAMMNIEEVERVLTAAIESAIAVGKAVKRGHQIRLTDHDCGCALHWWAGSKMDYGDKARAAFGWTSDRVWAFIDGFDTKIGEEPRYRYESAGNGDVFVLGRKLARKYVDGVQS